MTELKQLAENLRNYNAWRRGDGKNANIEMPHPRDLGTWIDSAIAVVEAHAECNQLARLVEKLESELKHWKSNHAAEVQRARVLKERIDMPLERVQAFEQIGQLIAERNALAAELKALREQEPVGFRFHGMVIAEYEHEESFWAKGWSFSEEKPKSHFSGIEHTRDIEPLYARPVPAKPVNQSRPLESIESSELRLELHLRAGPRYQCQSKDCKSYEDGPGQFDTCPGCGRKGYLCGSFVLDKNSTQYQQWVERTRDKYRGKSGQKNQSPEAGASGGWEPSSCGGSDYSSSSDSGSSCSSSSSSASN